MRLSVPKVRELARSRGVSLAEALRRSGVSRTAFYALARRRSLLPKTIRALSEALGVEPDDLLDAAPEPPEVVAERRLRAAREILRRHPDASFENVWHTLTLLDLPPAERLNRSLTRGRARAVHR